jgi:4'-phosphopantetheinyl transferase
VALDELSAGEVHLYLVDTTVVSTADHVRRHLAELQPDEVERYGRFRFDADRHEYLVTRALSRAVLSRYVDRPPESWRFVRTEHGRPLIAGAEADQAVRWISFSLSNTRGLVACAVARERAVGVDVEGLARHGDLLPLASRVLSALELAELRSCPAVKQGDRFLDYWTLKEAYLKARGEGLSLPLEAVSVLLAGAPPIRLELGAPLVDEGGEWQLELWSPTPSHRLALCVWRGADPPLGIELRWVEP